MKELKTFEISYTPNEPEGALYHLDFNVVITRELFESTLKVSGVDRVRCSRYHMCIFPGNLFEFDKMIESLLNHFKVLGFEYIGDFDLDEIRKIKKRHLEDPMESVLKDHQNKEPEKRRSDFDLDETSIIKKPIEINPENKIKKLKVRLGKALAKEDYESAAKFRDQIAELEENG